MNRRYPNLIVEEDIPLEYVNNASKNTISIERWAIAEKRVRDLIIDEPCLLWGNKVGDFIGNFDQPLPRRMWYETVHQSALSSPSLGASN